MHSKLVIRYYSFEKKKHQGIALKHQKYNSREIFCEQKLNSEKVLAILAATQTIWSKPNQLI